MTDLTWQKWLDRTTDQIPDADADPDEAFQLVFRELKRHEKTGRRNLLSESCGSA
ncbi:hypothetical protein [Pseudomonas phytophila]|uniref:hypothetical protein n=1 Tax=Pseudomonas phytophila TaxID=2867264 RepID=UPI0021D9812F|nr:hypothetical protein [Pseudomonas phytophila]